MTAPPLPDLAALKAELQSSRNIWAPGDLSDMCGRALAAIEALESRLAVPVGEALVEAAARVWCESRGDNPDARTYDLSANEWMTCCEYAAKHIRPVLAVVVPAVREEARIAANEQIIAEINDPRNASQPTDFRAGLRVARIVVNRALGEAGGE